MVVLFMTVLGVVVLLRGRLQFGKTRVVHGNRALLAGVVLITPMPAMYIANLLTSTLANPTLLNLSNPQVAAINDAIALSAMVLPALVIAHIAFHTPKSMLVAAGAQDDDDAPYPVIADFGTLEASLYLGKPEDDVLRLIQSGALIAHKINGRYRISLWAIEYFREHPTPAKAASAA